MNGSYVTIVTTTLFVFVAVTITNNSPSSLISAQLLGGSNVLTCDALILSGMRDCLTKFAPTSDPNPCCAYRKYRACTAGLRGGLKVAGKQAGCSNSFLAQAQMNRISDRLTGASLGNCKDSKKICRKSSRKSGNKKRTSSSSSSSDLLPIGGLDGIGSRRRLGGGLGSGLGGGFGDVLGGGASGAGGNPLGFVQNAVSSAVDSSRSLISGFGGSGGRRSTGSLFGNSPLDSLLGGGVGGGRGFL